MLSLPNFLTSVVDTATEVVDEVAAGAGEVAGELGETVNLTAEELNELMAAQAAQLPAVQTLTPVVIGVFVIFAILCIGLVVVILSQKKRSANPGGSTGIGGTYWDKNKGRSAEGKMELITKWGICAFMTFAFIISLNLIK